MNDRGKSDRPVVSRKPANKAGGKSPAAESVEKRGLAKSNPQKQTNHRAQNRKRLHHAQARIREAVKRDKSAKLTNLWHHVYDVDRLREAYCGINRKGATGIDGESWASYGENLENNLVDLTDRLRRGRYRARAVRRKYIPKTDGSQRPIGVPALEDKIVQRATVEVLNSVYECHFKGFSYGFRPGRSQHNALDALYMGIMKRKVNWVLDADIRGCFDAIDHDWLVKFVEHLIGDQRVVRHIQKWLKAGIMVDGTHHTSDEGTPQGGSISPLLCNIYLHYVFDLWIERWRKNTDNRDVIVVRYADDLVIGFQHRKDAERCLSELRARLKRFNLELHPEKTRLIEFGRYAANNRKARGEGKPETFDFLGFTHLCDRTRKNRRFIVRRQTMKKRLRAKLAEIRKELQRRMHRPIPETGKWLKRVMQGYYNYHAVPRNWKAMMGFYRAIARHWHRSLRRRSHKGFVDWRRMYRLINRWLPVPRVTHPYPEHRLCVMT